MVDEKAALTADALLLMSFGRLRKGLLGSNPQLTFKQ